MYQSGIGWPANGSPKSAGASHGVCGSQKWTCRNHSSSAPLRASQSSAPGSTSSARSPPQPRIRFIASMNPWFHQEAEWRNGKLEIEAVRQPAR